MNCCKLKRYPELAIELLHKSKVIFFKKRLQKNGGQVRNEEHKELGK